MCVLPQFMLGVLIIAGLVFVSIYHRRNLKGEAGLRTSYKENTEIERKALQAVDAITTVHIHQGKGAT